MAKLFLLPVQVGGLERQLPSKPPEMARTSLSRQKLLNHTRSYLELFTMRSRKVSNYNLELKTMSISVEEVGGKGLACVVDVRNESQVAQAVQRAVEEYGGIDILINNASAIALTNTESTEMKRFDLMHSINVRGTFLVSKLCLPHLKKSSHAHILNISPPLNLVPGWFGPHVAYTMSKYGMSMCVLGMQEEFKPFNIAVNALWPRTTIDTAALQIHPTGEDRRRRGRNATILADAAYWILTQEPKPNGQFFIDEEVLFKAGVTELDQYAVNRSYKDNLQQCIFAPAPAAGGDVIDRIRCRL
ncbi:hydroxysteroid dehydrogenase-like protein 2 isoform X1 [Photinus pyralis]|uniref:Hydroxysteroid dehydrogenase-like protein 2 n=3 Tax=Photinus pyralis TaxID=7054 RepID=A0A1Y1LI41_PHOPY|nr:hydroxysteroid dehydrogenase-like protein 2 isoform X1 [Photinus pyralis]